MLNKEQQYYHCSFNNNSRKTQPCYLPHNIIRIEILFTALPHREKVFGEIRNVLSNKYIMFRKIKYIFATN